jgi:putative multiple sugar transport system substrate-binding protein
MRQPPDIKVIAYDRLIRDTPNVDYYATFDNFQVGVQQAETLVDSAQGTLRRRKPFNIELFGGSPDDNNAFFFYDGAMSVLQPMIDAGSTSWSQVGPDRDGQGLDAALGRRRGAGAHGQPVSAYYTDEAGRRACCRPMTACRSASSRR